MYVQPSISVAVHCKPTIQYWYSAMYSSIHNLDILGMILLYRVAKLFTLIFEYDLLLTFYGPNVKEILVTMPTVAPRGQKFGILITFVVITFFHISPMRNYLL